MKSYLKIALAQLNLTVGDIDGNLAKHISAATKARDELHADIIVFPELGLTGYPAEDLLLRPQFIAEAKKAFQTFLSEVTGIYCLISHPVKTAEGLINSCSLVYNGTVVIQYAKQTLPNYGVFDECRYFIPGEKNCVVSIHGISTGIVICEDLWDTKPVKQAIKEGAKLILAPNASPFETNKHELRFAMLNNLAKENNVPIVYVNNVGGQDELVFDGGSMVVDKAGHLQFLAPFFEEALSVVEVSVLDSHPSLHPTLPNKCERIYDALVLALRDYVHKNNIKGVLLGLSGGIDSALTLCIAVDALGKDKVHAVGLSSQYTSEMSIVDAQLLADNLGVDFKVLSIEPAYQSFLETLAPSFSGLKKDVTEENIQARCRAVILMALSNKTGYLVLTTSNRSESAVGYTTLYGDMAGGFAVLKDVYKTMVYELARYRNTISAVIPERTIERAPSAELAPDQKDEDSLPPYAILDKILHLYLDDTKSIEEIVTAGFDRDVVMKVVNLIRKSEYKRRQAPIGPRINICSFGKDWRYPVTDKFMK